MIDKTTPDKAAKPAKKADPELLAMNRIARMLEVLSPSVRSRVAAWLYTRFCLDRTENAAPAGHCPAIGLGGPS